LQLQRQHLPVDDITERPQKLIAECGKTENDTLVPEDISTIRQASC
jgi:hypothetical protein